MHPRTFRMSVSGYASLLLALCGAAQAQRGDAPDTRLRPPTESQAAFRLPAGFEIQLVAAEPDLQKPFNLAFDAAGRVWVTGSNLYPWPARRDALGQPIASFEKNWDDNRLAFRATATPPTPPEAGIDTVKILSDFDPKTGRARKIVTFADGLNIPIGILPLPRKPEAKGDSALVFSIPAIWKLTDTDGDGRADAREKLYDGFGFKDTHGMSSSYWLWLDGWVYGTHGFANESTVVDREGRVTKLTSGNTYRFRPDGSRFEVYVHGQTNPYGLAFDARGDLYTADSHSKPVYLLIPGGYYEGINREHDGLGFAPAITTDDHGSSAIAGIAHYSATQFPPEYRDNLFNGNPVTRRINRARLDWRGSTPHAVRQPDFLTSDDPAFRPVQVKLGPDGALWIADFYNPVIGHYEVPLTHPARDHRHGRIWRVVWRGLNGMAPAATLPDLTQLPSDTLVRTLSDPNLVTRSLAAAELLVRVDARYMGSSLISAAARLASGMDQTADGTPALPLFLTLERLGRSAENDVIFKRTLSERPDSDVALAAIQTLTARDTLSPAEAALFTDLPKRTGNHRIWRATATLFAKHPLPAARELLLSLLLAAPEPDTELIYALRLALKAQLARAGTLAEIHALLDTAPKAARANAERALAEIALAVASPVAAEFLLGYLENNINSPRVGDLARHAILQLPPERIGSIQALLDRLAEAKLAQRVAVAEGLATLASKPGRSLPPEIATWMEAALLAGLADDDQPLVLRAINAVKPLKAPASIEPLRQIARSTKAREGNRIAALRALDPAVDGNIRVSTEVLGETSASNSLRRAAADQLGAAPAAPAIIDALTAASASASADLTLGLALALAQTEVGAERLLELAAAGKVRAQLLRHRHVELALQKRPAMLRERAVQLTRSLPDEDARLDAVIAQRLGAAGGFKTDVTRGAAVFGKHCALCHRFRETGGNLGPGLDGSESRTLARLVEDILDPSRNIDPGFRLTTVSLKSGEAKTGFNLRDAEGRQIITDPATGEDIAIDKTAISEITPSPVSPMPPTFETILSQQELFDVIAYLRGAK